MKTRHEERCNDRYLEFRNLQGQTIEEELAEMLKEQEKKPPKMTFKGWKKKQNVVDTSTKCE